MAIIESTESIILRLAPGLFRGIAFSGPEPNTPCQRMPVHMLFLGMGSIFIIMYQCVAGENNTVFCTKKVKMTTYRLTAHMYNYTDRQRHGNRRE